MVNMHSSTTICLIHWKDEEAAERLAWLQQAGYAAYHTAQAGPPLLRQLQAQPPSAIVIDLSRLPSHGREVAAALRASKATRYLPLVFVGGQPDKVARVRAMLPDAVYTSWKDIQPALDQAIAQPPKDPVILKSSMDAYAGQPLVKKLGIKPSMLVGLLDAPPDLPQTLGALPDGARLEAWESQAVDMLLWFVRHQAALEQGSLVFTAHNEPRFLWIAWPKKGSRLQGDLSQQVVRQIGLAAGWVDYKICSIDQTWSALLFTRRK